MNANHVLWLKKILLHANIVNKYVARNVWHLSLWRKIKIIVKISKLVNTSAWSVTKSTLSCLSTRHYMLSYSNWSLNVLPNVNKYILSRNYRLITKEVIVMLDIADLYLLSRKSCLQEPNPSLCKMLLHNQKISQSSEETVTTLRRDQVSPELAFWWRIQDLLSELIWVLNSVQLWKLKIIKDLHLSPIISNASRILTMDLFI